MGSAPPFIVLPFLIGGDNCQVALNSLELLLRNALVERSCFLNTVENLKHLNVGGDSTDIERQIAEAEGAVELIETLLMLVPEAKKGARMHEARHQIVEILRSQEQNIRKRADIWVKVFNGRSELLLADLDFLNLLTRIIEVDTQQQ